MRWTNPFKRAPAAQLPPPVTRGPAEFLSLILKNEEAYAVFRSFLEGEFSSENLEALAFLNRRYVNHEFTSPNQRHIFFSTFIAKNSSKSLNVSSKARPNLKNTVPGMSGEMLGMLDYVGEMPMFLTPEVMEQIRRDVVLTLCDSWGRFELTVEGRQLIAKLDPMP